MADSVFLKLVKQKWQNSDSIMRLLLGEPLKNTDTMLFILIP